MNMFARSVFFTLALAAASSSHASTIPVAQSAPIPDVQVLDEASRSASLRSMLTQSGGGPVILLPIFTRCAASCPVLTRKLETALGGINPAEPYRVVVFSFDPLETSESLRLYRLQQNVPADWKIVRSNEGEIRRFFGFFRYAVMNQDGKLVHPNEVFLLDQDLRWRWTLVGEDWSSTELASAIKLDSFARVRWRDESESGETGVDRFCHLYPKRQRRNCLDGLPQRTRAPLCRVVRKRMKEGDEP